jgi:tetratricopeptide (TPR) repeat protein
MDRGSRLWVIQFYQSVFCKDDYDPTKFLRQSIEIDDQEPSSYRKLGDRYYQRLQYDKAISEYKKALEIYNKWGIKVSSVYTSLGRAYRKTGQYRKAKKIYKKAERDFPDNPQLIAGQAVLSLTLRDTVAANQYIKKYILIQKYNSSSEANISLALGQIYWGAGMLDKAEEYYRKALSLDPENPVRLNALAAFLIEIDRNKNESLNLIDKAIKLSPDNLGYLDTKGWGLYKLGKYKEALELIQKSWDSLPFYVYEVYSHLEAAKKALEKQK